MAVCGNATFLIEVYIFWPTVALEPLTTSHHEFWVIQVETHHLMTYFRLGCQSWTSYAQCRIAFQVIWQLCLAQSWHSSWTYLQIARWLPLEWLILIKSHKERLAKPKKLLPEANDYIQCPPPKGTEANDAFRKRAVKEFWDSVTIQGHEWVWNGMECLVFI